MRVTKRQYDEIRGCGGDFRLRPLNSIANTCMLVNVKVYMKEGIMRNFSSELYYNIIHVHRGANFGFAEIWILHVPIKEIFNFNIIRDVRFQALINRNFVGTIDL